MSKSFKSMILGGEVKRADAMRMRLEDLHPEPNFNLRDPAVLDEEGKTLEESIRDLAEYMAGGGIVPPLEVRPREEGGAWLVDGHRRHAALLLLDSEGRLPRTPSKSDPAVLEAWIPVLAFEGNEVDRTVRVIDSQQNRRLHALEVAMGYKRLRAFGLDSNQIAARFRRTRPHVDSLLLLANAPVKVQQLVAAGKVAPYVAIDAVRQHGEKAGEVLAAQVEQAQSNGKARATKTTIEGKRLPPKVVTGLVARLDGFIASLPPNARTLLASLENAEKAGQLPEDQCVSVPASALLALVNEHGKAQEVRAKQQQRMREQQSKAAQQELPAA